MSKLMQQLKRIVLFLLSPLFALAYMGAFPMVAAQMFLSDYKQKSKAASRPG